MQGRDAKCCAVLSHTWRRRMTGGATLPGWLGIAFTYQGLKALGVDQASLDSFPEEFREGMAARASILNDVGDNAPRNWEYPFGTTNLHIALAIYSKNDESLKIVLARARQSHHDLPRISVIYRLKFSELPGGRNPFGFRTGFTIRKLKEAAPRPSGLRATG